VSPGFATAPQLRQRAGLTVLAWPAFDGMSADAMITSRDGGVSRGGYATLNLSFGVGDEPADVAENRHRVAAAMGSDLGDFVFAHQVHGRTAAIVTRADRGRGAYGLDDAVPAADALVTRDPQIVLAMLAADCLPVVLFDPVGQVLACVHAGWRGTVAGVTQAALAAMAALGTRPGDVIAGLGPGISPDRFQVGGDVMAAVRQSFGAQAEFLIRPDGTGRWLFDLWAANRHILAEAGVPASQIHVAAVPTGGEQGLFFSHRQSAPCGRFAAVARLRPGSGT
jgi:polyphenol oxidase